MIGPFVLLFHGLYILLAVWITRVAMRVIRAHFGPIAAVTIGLVSVLVFVLIPTWDELLGSYQYAQLCKHEAGVRFYEKMELPREFYSDSGEPLFISSNGNIDGWFNKRGREDKTNLYRYVEFPKSGKKITAFADIEQLTYCVANKASGKELACSIGFSYHGGWWKRFSYVNIFQWHPCGEQIRYKESYRKIFLPVQRQLDSNQGEAGYDN